MKNGKLISHLCVFASSYDELVRLRCCVPAYSNITERERERERKREREREIQSNIKIQCIIYIGISLIIKRKT